MHIHFFYDENLTIPDIYYLYFVMDLYLFTTDKVDELNITAL